MIDSKMIIGKSDPNSSNFDILISAILDIYDAQIPSYIKHIAPYCFANTKNLKEITFSEDSELLSIEENSFNDSYLRSISLPSKLENLADGWCNSMKKLAFFSVNKNNKKFASIDHKTIVAKSDSKSDDYDVLVIVSSKTIEFTVPSNIKYISPFCFNNCKKLKSVVFPDDSELINIGKNAFSNTKIESISLPKKLREMPELWLDKVKNLKTVFVSPSNSNYAIINNDLIVWKSEQNKEDFDVLLFANRSIKQAEIPCSIEYIAPHCFEECKSLKKIHICNESKLKKIGDFAFCNSAISKVDIPIHVKSIGKSCFENCKSLEYVTFAKDSELNLIDDNAFSNTFIMKIEIPSQVEYIGKRCFDSCYILRNVIFPEDLKMEVINCETFQDSSIESIFIPKNVQKIDKSAFNNCFYLEEVKFADDSKLVSIGYNSFSNTAIKSINIPKHTKIIDDNAFTDCKKLQSVNFDEDSQLEIIGSYALCRSSVKSISLPKSVQKIKNYAFRNDTILDYALNFPVFNEETKRFEVKSPKNNQQILLMENIQLIIPDLLNNNIYAIHGDLIVQKSNPNLDEYDTLIGSLNAIEHLIIPSYIKYIKERCFFNNPQLKSLEFPEDSQLLVIGKSSFAYTGIKAISIPEHVKIIEENAFYNCQELKTIEIPQNSELQIIKPNSFIKTKIKEIFIPDHLKGTHLYLSFNMDEIVDIKISSNNKNFAYIDDKMIIGKSDPNIDVFDSLIFAKRNIERALIPSYIKYIKPFCFCHCTSLTNVEFADDSQLVSISELSFMLSAITRITIPSTVEFIGSNAFMSCKNLESVIFPEDSKLESFSKNMFLNTKIEEITVPVHVKRISTFCFPYTLKKINFHENSELEHICENAFQKTAIQNITIPSNVEIIESKAFNDCSQIQTFSFGKNAKLNSLDTNVFYKTNIQRLIIPANVKIIHNSAFFQSKIESLEFEENSNLSVIEPGSFSFAKISIFNIPEKVTFSHGFAKSTFIYQFRKSPNNNNCKLLNDRMLIVKSQPNFDFNTLIYVISGYDLIIVPSYIQKIAKFCFSEIKDIEFEKDSKLVSIGRNAFEFCLMDKISLPKHVKILKENSFQFCDALKELIIPEDSELEFIAQNAFEDDIIDHLYIPSNFKKIEFDDYYIKFSFKSISVSPKNNNFKLIDNGVIIGKSQENIDIFDTLVFVSKNIKVVKVPSYIKYIGPCSFCQENIRSIEFQNDSQLQSIGKGSFSRSYIKNISIPSSCVDIGKGAFYNCNNLEKINFDPDSKLENIEKEAFMESSLVGLCIPKYVKYISLTAFMKSMNLRSIEFLSDTLVIINEYNWIQNGFIIIAIPNATYVNYRYYKNFRNECILLVNAKAMFVVN